MWVNDYWLLLGNHTHYPGLLSGSSAEKRQNRKHTKKNGCRGRWHVCDDIWGLTNRIVLLHYPLAGDTCMERNWTTTVRLKVQIWPTRTAVSIVLLAIAARQCAKQAICVRESYVKRNHSDQSWQTLAGIVTVPNRLRLQVAVSNMI